jgi:hypothetical protein
MADAERSWGIAIEPFPGRRRGGDLRPTASGSHAVQHLRIIYRRLHVENNFPLGVQAPPLEHDRRGGIADGVDHALETTSRGSQ